MTQEEVYKFLKKSRKWRTTKEISENIGVQSGSTLKNLNSLFKYKEVVRKIKWIGGYYIYMWKIK